MGWLLKRKLTETSRRLRALREELAQLDEQVEIFTSDADAHEMRALVSETPGASQEAVEARRHASAVERHRATVKRRIVELEQRQDELLDRLSTGDR